MKTSKIKLFIICFMLLHNNSFSQNWHVPGYTEEKAKDYFLFQYKYIDAIEGIWQSSDGFRYAIEKDVENGRRTNNKYRVIVLVGGYREWKLGDIKGFIDYGSSDGFYSMTYYLRSIGSGYYAENTTSSQSLLLFFDGKSKISFSYRDDGYYVTQKDITWVKIYP